MTEPRLLFPQDKNYILKEAQTDTKQFLILDLIEKVRETYLSKHNSLGLEDDTVRAIKECRHFVTANLDHFYEELSGIYRYKVGSNQLEFIFSGKSHYEKYCDDWTDAFELWMEDFLTSFSFIRAVLEMTILNPTNRVASLATNRLKVFLSQYFKLKVYKYRGILPIQAA